MNKVHYLFILLVMLIGAMPSCVVFGQAHFGVRAGLNLAKVSFDDGETTSVTKYNAGVFSEINFNEGFFMRPELAYSVKGWKYMDATIDLHYLNLPILFGFRPAPGVVLVAGPEFGYLMKVKRKPEVPVMPGFEKFDYGVAVGGAYRILKELSIDVRYTHGFDTLIKAGRRDVNNAPTGEVYRDGANRVFFVGLSYLFRKD